MSPRNLRVSIARTVLLALSAGAVLATGPHAFRAVYAPDGSAPPRIRQHVPLIDPFEHIFFAYFSALVDDSAIPLRWRDPATVLRCGPESAVSVNGEPLHAGDLVPQQPFLLAWHADHCTGPGTGAPSLDGDVTLTVYREDWGFSASIVPHALRVFSGDGGVELTGTGGASS